MSEADALKKHREDESKNKAAVEEHLAAMEPDIEWRAPPSIATDGFSMNIAAGEESKELEVANRRRKNQPPFSGGRGRGSGEGDAREPEYGADRGYAEPLHGIQRIPLSTEEAQKWRVEQQQRHLQQQQQRHHHHHPPHHNHHNLQHQRPGPTPMRKASNHSQHPPPMTTATTTGPAPPPVALPEDLSTILAQLAGSGVLGGAGAPPPQAPPPSHHHTHHHQHGGGESHHHQQQRKPSQRRGGPPGMRIMMGLHRPATGGTGGEVSPSPPPDAHPPQPHQRYEQPPAGPPSIYTGGNSGSGRSRVPCRFYNRPGGCKHGDQCPFGHS